MFTFDLPLCNTGYPGILKVGFHKMFECLTFPENSLVKFLVVQILLKSCCKKVIDVIGKIL